MSQLLKSLFLSLPVSQSPGGSLTHTTEADLCHCLFFQKHDRKSVVVRAIRNDTFLTALLISSEVPSRVAGCDC